MKINVMISNPRTESTPSRKSDTLLVVRTPIHTTILQIRNLTAT